MAPAPQRARSGRLTARALHAIAGEDRGRQMRFVATGLLVLMAAVFLTARQFDHLHPAIGYIVAFSEAAMVGGLADWFAVTALFRHPMGIPIPHTAIIPVNKDRIADTMAQFLRDNFLTPQVVARRLSRMNVAVAAGGFLAAPKGSENRLQSGAASLIGDVLESLDADRLGGMAKSALRRQLEKLEVAPLLGQLISGAIADRRHLEVMDSIIIWTARTLEANEELIRVMIHDRANAVLRFTGLDEKLANGVIDGLYKLLEDMAGDLDHPVRAKIEEALETLAHDLIHKPEMQARVQAMKAEVLANPAMTRWFNSMWERARAAMLRATRDPEAAMGGQLGESLAELGRALESDVRLQRLVNRFSRRTLVGISHRYGGQIVQLVSETVKRWDATTLTARVENAVGRDLQFIRVNGTLVGGLVGVIIHAVDQFL